LRHILHLLLASTFDLRDVTVESHTSVRWEMPLRYRFNTWERAGLKARR
jgi:hypothetical protein